MRWVRKHHILTILLVYLMLTVVLSYQSSNPTGVGSFMAWLVWVTIGIYYLVKFAYRICKPKGKEHHVKT